jgi:hypothetical protein
MTGVATHAHSWSVSGRCLIVGCHSTRCARITGSIKTPTTLDRHKKLFLRCKKAAIQDGMCEIHQGGSR